MLPVRIAVDVRGVSEMPRGIDSYTINLLTKWQRDNRAQVSLIRTRTGPPPPIEIEAPFAKLSFARTLLQRVPGLTRPLDQIGKAHDVVFLPNMAVYPRGGCAPLAVTAHDATALRHPEFFTRRDQLWHWLVNLNALVRSADLVLANSEQTRSELIEIGVLDERIRVIHLGIDEVYSPVSAEAVGQVLAKYDIPVHPYFLFLGAVEPRKNIRALIRGYLEARRRGLKASLVLAGPVRCPDELAEANEDVRVLGWIDAADKPALYSGATALVSLAHHEGFGFVPLEAFACGTRPILSRLPVYAETIGGWARYVESDDSDVVASAMLEEQASSRPTSPSEVKRLRERFSWTKCAHDTLTELIETVDSRNLATRG